MKPQITFIFFWLILLYFNVISQTPGTIDESFGESGIIFTDFDNDFNSVTKVFIQDDGRKIAQLMNEIILPGYHEQTLKLPGNIRAGSYLLQLSTSKGTEFEKVIVMER